MGSFSLKGFLEQTKNLEKKAMESSIVDAADKQVQSILSESAVKLSVYNNLDKSTQERVNMINDGIKQVVSENNSRISLLIDQMFHDASFDEEHERIWVDKLSSMFNIDKELNYEDRKVLIDKHMNEDDATLSYIAWMLEHDKNS